MSMTITQKILSRKADRQNVSEGELIEAKVDLIVGNDITTPVAIHEFNKLAVEDLFDKSKIAIVPDHFTPNKDIDSAEQCKLIREFASKHEIDNYFEIGEMGIEHGLIPEKGLVAPGDAVIGADSHTCTYGALGAFSTGIGSTDMAAAMASGKCWFKVPGAIRVNLTGKPAPWVSGKDVILHLIGEVGVDGALYKSLEFAGSGIAHLSMDDRFSIANMAIEAGAKNGIFPVDQITLEYVDSHSTKTYEQYTADKDAPYELSLDIKMDDLSPTISLPHLPSNTKRIEDVGEINIDQVVIGSCTNGRIEDLRTAARILKGQKVCKGIRVLIIPVTQKVYLDALREGLLEIFIEAGAVVSTPTCGPCLGGHMGVLARGERAVATTNRNFVGRMGHPESEVFLASPAVAAASALTGMITDPRNIYKEDS